MGRFAVAFVSLLVLTECRESPGGQKISNSPPSILLVTLDTTRADSIGPHTPSFNSMAKRGRVFTQAYATVPETLPSHASMLTGVYPAAHRLHENARYLSENQPLVAERLRQAGYRTAAFVSAYPLARQFGLGRGFEVYDDEFGEAAERSARETTDRALAYIRQHGGERVFVWVHYFEPHHPYEPPEPFRSRFAGDPYRGEVAAMDHELGRLLAGFNGAVIISADHGEGLGDHGEAQHGDLLYQPTMHVPLAIAGPGVRPGIHDVPVSTRRIYHSILDWAGVSTENTLLGETTEVVLGEAMKPFLNYGWQPQVMAISGRQKVISAGAVEIYDVVADPAETHDLAARSAIPREVRQGIRDYPLPQLGAPVAPTAISEEDRRRLASLGYVASEVTPVVRKDAPRPRDMTAVLELLNAASALFAQEQYARAVPLFQQSLSKDPHNLSAALRLAVAYSSLGQNKRALAEFQRAEQIAPQSLDVKHYLALHALRSGDAARAEALLEQVLAATPNRLPALEALARVREQQQRWHDAVALWQKVLSMKSPSPPELLHLGEVAMRVGNTSVALQAFEQARAAQGSAFANELELGVLYLAAGRLAEARDALDRVSPSDAGYPMALFKRAQVSVLLREPDASARIELARTHADRTTRELIGRERLFQGK